MLAGTRDGGDSSETKRKPSPIYFPSANSSSPIYINVQVNKKHQSAIVDTGSAVTIINQQLLKKIDHKGLVFTNKLHQSANSTSIDIIGEIQLEIQIQGYKTTIVADVAKNLVTDLLLGNDWIGKNNVIIDSPQQ
jgi:gag-polyprotein putative aspartyl protease